MWGCQQSAVPAASCTGVRAAEEARDAGSLLTTQSAPLTSSPAPLHGRRSSSETHRRHSETSSSQRTQLKGTDKSKKSSNGRAQPSNGRGDEGSARSKPPTCGSARRRNPSGKSGLTAAMRSLSMGSERERPGWGAAAPGASRSNSMSRVRDTGVGGEGGGGKGPKVLGVPRKVPHPAGGAVDVLEYAPQGSAPPAGIIVALPGSNGGFGPGIEKTHAGLPLSRQGSLAALGSLYARLGLELSTGLPFDWGNRQVGQGAGGGTVDTSRQHYVVLQATWRLAEDGTKWPGPKLKHLDSLAAACEDVQVLVQWAIDRYKEVPVILCGFSFGGPAVLAAARAIGSGRICGVVVIAGSARGGERFQRRKLDTLGSITALTKQNIPVLFIHGTRDSNVAVEIPLYMSQNVGNQAGLTLALIRSSMHQMDRARDTAYPLLRKWVVRLMTREAERRAVGCEDALSQLSTPSQPKVLRLDLGSEFRALRKDPIVDEEQLPVVRLEQLQSTKLKGYSE